MIPLPMTDTMARLKKIPVTIWNLVSYVFYTEAFNSTLFGSIFMLASSSILWSNDTSCESMTIGRSKMNSYVWFLEKRY